MQKNRTNAMIALLALLLAGTATTVSARPEPGDGGGRRGPPPEAINACEGKQVNDQCSFKGRGDETLTGICAAPPNVDELACAPEGGPPERGGR